MAVLHTPRMVALIPGQSPPEVKIPILIVLFISQKLGDLVKLEDFNDYFRRKIEKKINKVTFARINIIMLKQK